MVDILTSKIQIPVKSVFRWKDLAIIIFKYMASRCFVSTMYISFYKSRYYFRNFDKNLDQGGFLVLLCYKVKRCMYVKGTRVLPAAR